MQEIEAIFVEYSLALSWGRVFSSSGVFEAQRCKPDIELNTEQMQEEVE